MHPPTSDKNQHDTALVVVHISDIHWGSKGAESIWNQSLAPQLRSLRPALILVTGDLVDSPKRALLDQVRQALQNLGPSYLVIPGNHDRSPYGTRLTATSPGIRLIPLAASILSGIVLHSFSNRIPEEFQLWSWLLFIALSLILFLIGPRLIQWLWSFLGSAQQDFYQVFSGEHVITHNPVTRHFGPSTNSWNLGLIGLDSSENADCLARGYVEDQHFESLGDSTRGSWDLLLLLIHHHLLPVRSLETKIKGNPLQLLNVTTMANSGQILESLAHANIDVVLHGHEHSGNVAGYHSPIAHGTVSVIAAGSCTGKQHDECNLASAAFNVLLLKPNRSVVLRQYNRQDNRWTHGPDIQLLSSKSIRKSVSTTIEVCRQCGAQALQVC